jgi:nicotinamidase-related amidase
MSFALLIIDVQRGLCEGEHTAFEPMQTITRINRVARKARAAAVPVVLIQHEAQSGLLEYGSESWQLALGLESEASDLRLRKTATDSFHRTDLNQLLQDRSVTELVICGMHSEFCIDTTTRRALAHGYPVVLVEDGHTTESKAHLNATQIIAHHNATLTNISSFGPRARLVKADDLDFLAKP